MRRILALLLVVMLLAPGCATGVSQEEYDKASSDLASAQAQLSILQSDYEKANSDYEKANSDLAKIQTQLAKLQSDYDKKNSDLTEAQAQRYALQSDYNEVKRDLSTVRAEISALESRILDLYRARPTTTVEVTKDVEYGRADDIPLLLDIYTPETPIASPMPAIIVIHGGGWIRGDKGSELYVSRSYYLASHGFFVVSINYRLSGVAPFPAAVEDSKCAVRWLRANAEKYNVDPERIGVAGGSAGGHLALMVGLVDETAALEGNGGWEEFSSRVQAVVSNYGISSFFEEVSSPARVQFLGGTPEEKPEIYKAASPINYVTEDDPPLLLIHGELDSKVPYNQSEIMYQAYQQAGLEATLIKVSNAGHGFRQETDNPISPSLDEIEKIRLDFFIKHSLLNR